jgi:protein-S-isoprenylcysteine O-methyltransferase Ste14
MVTSAPIDDETTFLEWYEVLWSLAFAVDVVYSATGYATSVRLLDTHVESSEPTVAGWLVALVCYEPFWGTIYDRYLAYDSGVAWGDWLEDYPAFRAAWACTILFLIGVYSWASVTFGLRFSNLTRRGILTNGPYRWTKHPAYVAKNLSWWLVSIPFAVEAEWPERVRLCVLMLGVNFIYFLRAKTEERHLRVAPEYVEYERWIDQHGIFRWVRWPGARKRHENGS